MSTHRAASCSLALVTVLTLLGAVIAPDPAAATTPTVAGSGAPGGSGQDADRLARLDRHARERGRVRVIVGLKVDTRPEGDLEPSAVAEQRTRIARAQQGLERGLGAGHTTVRDYRTIPFRVMEVSAAALDGLRRSPLVDTVVEDTATPPMLGDTTPLIEAPAMWSTGATGAGQAVAVLDTGVETAHPFFGGRVVSEACYSTNDATDGSTSLCPGAAPSATGAGSGADCPVTVAGCGHGTHVAGIAVGSGASFSGVAKAADLIAIKVFSRFDTLTDCSRAPCVLSYVSDQVAGLERVLELSATMRIAAVNMSIGGGRFSGPCDAAEAATKSVIDHLWSAGVATVIASGNNGWVDSVSAPGCISSAVTVGNTLNDDRVAVSSNGAPQLIDLLAPGTSVTSSYPGGGYATLTGTSMAAPHVAGAFAVLRSRTPGASPRQLLDLMQSNGVLVTDQRAGAGFLAPRLRFGTSNFTGDTLATAHSVTTLPYSLRRTTFGSGIEPGEPGACPGGGGTIGASVWLTTTPTVDGDITVSTAGSDFDTVAGVYTGASVSTLTPVAGACNDDLSSSDRSSLVTFRARAGVTYRVQVAGWNGQVGRLVVGVSSVPVTVAPGSPTGLTATPADRAVGLGWSAPASDGGAPITAYRVEQSTDGVGWVTVAQVSSRTHVAGGLVNGVTYRFRISAINAVGAGAPSAVIASSPRTVPSAPQSPGATAGNGSVVLVWRPPANDGGRGVTAYRVQRSTDGVNWIESVVPASTLSITVAGLTNGVDHRFRIAAVNEAGSSAWSTVVTARPQAPVK